MDSAQTRLFSTNDLPPGDFRAALLMTYGYAGKPMAFEIELWIVDAASHYSCRPIACGSTELTSTNRTLDRALYFCCHTLRPLAAGMDTNSNEPLDPGLQVLAVRHAYFFYWLGL
jgi:hypothetical protein